MTRAFQLELARLLTWALAGHCAFGLILLTWRAAIAARARQAITREDT